MRIELTLKRQEAIEELFGTCYLNELTDEQINKVFTDFIKVNIKQNGADFNELYILFVCLEILSNIPTKHRRITSDEPP